MTPRFPPSARTVLHLVVASSLFLARSSGATGADAALVGDWSVRGGGTWVYGNRIVRQTDNALVDPKKYILPALTSSGDQAITAQVRVDSFPNSISRVGVSLRTDVSTGNGYNFVLIAGNQVAFLADKLAWGNTCPYSWSYGNWYSMKLTISGTTLTGKIWADGQTESQATVCTQSGWSYYSSGAPGLNGGSFGETASFDNVIAGGFADTFNTNSPPAPPQPPANFLTSGQFLNQVQARSNALGFNLGRFIDIMQTTAQNLVCTNNPSVCQNYTQGTFAVVPSPFYGSGTWMRDATWTLGALNNVNQFASLTTKFAVAGNGTSGQIATLIPNNGGPWFGAGGQGNPLPDDDSDLMFAIAARLGWQTAASQSYLINVYNWIRSHADGNGNYPATSHGWEDSFYPLGTGGPASVTVSANMQGLYAVALRALKDLGVNVPQAEIDAANAQYANLTINGRLRAYQNTDIVDVASLMGEALSLFIWNQPILSDAVVQNTIASFAEVYDSNQNFVGYKVLSNANQSFLPAGMFPVENGGAGLGGGYYQNGGSWMLYDVLALYAGARHNIPSMRDTYIDRLAKRMASELRAGVGSTPANKSEEFLCTAPGNPGDPCQPTGSAEAQRADYGWNAFVVRLLSNESPISSADPVLTTSPISLRFAATKAGASGDLVSVTPPQTVTVTFSGTTSTWSTGVDQPWVQITNGSGSGNGRFTVAIQNPNNVLAASTNVSATITITPGSGSLSAVMIPVTLTINQSPTTTSGPVGQVDTPAQSAASVVGAIGVTGWVIDDIGIQSVKLYRNCLAAEPQVNCDTAILAGQSVVYIGDAVLVNGARPDIEAAFPTYPATNQAGWGLQVLTNMLPRTTGTYAGYGGQGPVTFYVVARDIDGHSTLLGRAYTGDQTPTSITMDNDNIAKPFGTIDTPGQGATISGTYANFGWSLTPDSNTVADGSDILIPTNGSTMFVFIDGTPVAPVAYNQCRGNVGNPVPGGTFCNDDVANIFGNPTPQPSGTTRTSNPTKFRNLDAGRGAIGAYAFDTAALGNGLHTLAWSVTDSAGRVEGVGSRFFTVLNSSLTGSGAVLTAAEAQAAPSIVRGPADAIARLTPSSDAIVGRAGFDLRTPFEPVARNDEGAATVKIPPSGRVELALGPVDRGYLVANGTLRDLPPGSRLEADGSFTWVAGPGYLGTYDLAFVRGGERIPVKVTIASDAAGAGESEVRMSLDLPEAHATVRGTVTIAGWALDPQAFTGSGIETIHVWARRIDVPGGAARFVGTADLNGSRPDVAAAFGAQFDRAGFGLTAALPAGTYEITAYAWCTRTGRFEDARTAQVSVR